MEVAATATAEAITVIPPSTAFLVVEATEVVVDTEVDKEVTA